MVKEQSEGMMEYCNVPKCWQQLFHGSCRYHGNAEQRAAYMARTPEQIKADAEARIADKRYWESKRHSMGLRDSGPGLRQRAEEADHASDNESTFAGIAGIEIGPGPQGTEQSVGTEDIPVSRSTPNKWGEIEVFWSSGRETVIMDSALEDAEYAWLRGLPVREG